MLETDIVTTRIMNVFSNIVNRFGRESQDGALTPSTIQRVRDIFTLVTGRGEFFPPLKAARVHLYEKCRNHIFA